MKRSALVFVYGRYVRVNFGFFVDIRDVSLTNGGFNPSMQHT